MNLKIKIDLTPFVRGPRSSVGLTSYSSFQAIQKLRPDVLGIARVNHDTFEKLSTFERVFGSKETLHHSFEHRQSPLLASKKLLSIHDLWTLNPKNQWQAPNFQKKQAPLLEQAIKKAHYITVPSEHSLEQLRTWFPQTKHKSEVVCWGPILNLSNSTQPTNVLNTSILELQSKKYFLTVANFENRKNYSLILKAIRHFRHAERDAEFVFVGSLGFKGSEILNSIEEFQMDSQNPKIHLFHQLQTHELDALYKKCLGVVLPSFDEGFGLPALEAATSGKPLILSHIKPFIEIAGSCALYFDPFNGAEELRSHLSKLISDPTLASDLGQKAHWQSQNFSWEKTALKFVEIYKKLGF